MKSIERTLAENCHGKVVIVDDIRYVPESKALFSIGEYHAQFNKEPITIFQKQPGHIPDGSLVRAKSNHAIRYVTRQSSNHTFEDDGKVSCETPSSSCLYVNYEFIPTAPPDPIYPSIIEKEFKKIIRDALVEYQEESKKKKWFTIF